MHDDHDQTSAVDAAKLPWTTPSLGHLGDMSDVKGNGAQPPNDGSFSPSRAAS